MDTLSITRDFAVVRGTVDGKTWRCAYSNCAGDRAAIASRFPELWSEIQAVWGDAPTVLPEPEREPAPPSAMEDMESLLIDHEERLIYLELGV